jgi:biotin transport system substrate-specific component
VYNALHDTEGFFMAKARIFSTRDICYIGIFVAIMAICAQIRIPLPGGIDVTLQTWGIALAGMILGPKKGVVAVAVYILLGVAGVPVFTRFRGGIGVLAGATGGFIVSFPVIALLAGICVRKSNAVLLAGLVVATLINLAFGMVWFAAVLQNSLQVAFLTAVAPFILPDILKNIAVILVGRSILAALAKAKITPS